MSLYGRTIEIYYPYLNYLAKEPVDPFIELFLSQLSQGNYLLGQVIILFLGLFYLYSFSVTSKKVVLQGVVLTLIAILFVSGGDSFYLRLHWFPFLLASLIYFRAKASVVSLITVLFSCFAWVCSAGSIGPFGALLALCVSSIVQEVRENTKRSFFLILGIFLTLTSVAYLPVFELPDYPPGARISPISVLTFREPPLIGPWLEPNPVLYQQLVQTTKTHLFRLLFFVAPFLCFIYFTGIYKSARSQVSLAVLFLICLILACEVYFPDSYLLYAPFQILRSIVPGIALVELSWVLIPFAIILAVFFLVPQLTLKNMKSFILVFVFLGVFEIFVLERHSIIYPLPQSVDHFEKRKSNFNLASSYIVRSSGKWVVEEVRSFDSLYRFKKGVDYIATASATVNSEEAIKALDHDPATRWSTARAQQAGDSFEINFDREVELLRVVLSIRNNPTDFPRGLRVEVWNKDGEVRTVFSQPEWFGAIRWNENGDPYYGSQSDVVLDFSEQEKVSGLRLVQIGNGPHFDWSINELKFYRYGQD